MLFFADHNKQHAYERIILLILTTENNLKTNMVSDLYLKKCPIQMLKYYSHSLAY